MQEACELVGSAELAASVVTILREEEAAEGAQAEGGDIAVTDA